MVVLLEKGFKRIKFWGNVNKCRAIHWGMSSVPVATLPEKKYFPNAQYPWTANSSPARSMTLWASCSFMLECTLAWCCVRLVQETITPKYSRISCPEDRSHSTLLYAQAVTFSLHPPWDIPWVLGKVDINIPFRVEHSSVHIFSVIPSVISLY